MNSKGISEVTAGYASWRWLSGVASKQGQWLLGSLANRGKYEAWVAYLFKGLQEPSFLVEFDSTTDPWAKSKLVGEKISQLSASFKKLSTEEKLELSKKAEVELKAGIELLKGEKTRVLELLKTVTAPVDS
jgi:hypothetical protein